MTAEVEIPIRVIGKPRPRVTRWGTYTPKPARLCEESIRLYLKLWVKKKDLKTPVEGCLEVHVIATYEVPKSYSKRDRAACLLGLLPVKDYDVDNIAKMVLDAANGVIWKDDKSVVRLIAEKHYGNSPKLLFRIRRL